MFCNLLTNHIIIAVKLHSLNQPDTCFWSFIESSQKFRTGLYHESVGKPLGKLQFLYQIECLALLLSPREDLY